MTNALVIYEQFETLQRASKALYASGYWPDAKSEAQAIVKVMAGAELGLPPFAAMTGIHIVQGKPVLGANVVATLIKNDPRYDYRVKQRDNTACILVWFENGQLVGEAGFTMQEAKEAGLAGKDNWKKYPSDMLFARAVTRGARTYAPGIFGGSPVYTPDEMNVDTDIEGYVIEGHATELVPNPIEDGKGNSVWNDAPERNEEQPPTASNGDGPLPDDEQVILESTVKDFLPTVAANLGTDIETITTRLHALGYSKLPGKPQERVNAYRLLKSAVAKPEPEQGDWLDEPAPAANGAYQS